MQTPITQGSKPNKPTNTTLNHTSGNTHLPNPLPNRHMRKLIPSCRENRPTLISDFNYVTVLLKTLSNPILKTIAGRTKTAVPTLLNQFVTTRAIDLLQSWNMPTLLIATFNKTKDMHMWRPIKPVRNTFLKSKEMVFAFYDFRITD